MRKFWTSAWVRYSAMPTFGKGFRSQVHGPSYALVGLAGLIIKPLHPDDPFAKRNLARLKGLSGRTYVDRLSCEMREMFSAERKDHDVELYARFRFEREDCVLAMALARIGIAVMPNYSVTVPDLLQRPITDPVISRTIALINMPGRP